MDQKKVLSEIKGFRGSNESTIFAHRTEESLDMQDQLNRARLRELTLKHYSRIFFTLFTTALLVAQNIGVFLIIWRAYDLRELKDLQLIFATLTAATLTETYFVIKVIIDFVFSTSDYSVSTQK